MLPHWTQGDVDVNGVKIHYYRTGDGSKPALVLAHGFSDGGLCWLPVARDLEADFDVVLPDARGHGLSQRLQTGEHIDQVADLAGLIRSLQLNRPVVGGHSMGAGVSAALGARFPDLARALILEDPPWWLPRPEAEEKPKDEEPKENPYHAWLKSLESATIEEVIAKCRADSPTWAEVELRPWAETKMQFDPVFFTTEGEWMDWQEILGRLIVPTLLIKGDHEKGAIVTPDVAQRAVEINPLVQVADIAGVGHNIRRENYPDFMAALRRFLQELD